MRLAVVWLAGVALVRGQSGSTSERYGQQYRPQYHFSPRENWTNDPNGLVYFEGEYHLFFQFNPFGDEWGHMTWGHAVSPDLVHWQQLPPAIPEQNGRMIFTGSTVVDEQNTSGFCAPGKACLVAVYTGHVPESNGHPALQTQNLAYSNDRGRTWTKYAGNPVLNLHMSDFRDPKVFWSAATKRWVMVVSLPNEHKVRIYGSPDLKGWSALSDFGPAGATDGQWECPELFELPVESGRETRWVLKIGLNPGALQGGSGEQYFVGRFDGVRFTNENPPSQTMWTDYGKDCYCALTFNHLPHEQPEVMIGWMDNWQYAKDLPTSPWRGQMTFPRRLWLRRTPEGLRLVQAPVDQLGSLEGQKTGTAGDVAAVNRWLAQSDATKTGTYRLQSEMRLGNAREIGWRILEDESHYTAIICEAKTQRLIFDRSHSGRTDFNTDFAGRVKAPLVLRDGVLRLDVLVDKNSVEIFADGGRIADTNLVFPSRGATGIQAYTNGRAGQISVELTPIHSIWTSH